MRTGSTVIRSYPSTKDGYRLSSTVRELTFLPSGFGTTTPLADHLPRLAAGQPERSLTLSVTGRITIERTRTGSCS